MPTLDYSQIIESSKWVNQARSHSLCVPKSWHKWLFDQGSLTQLLIAHSKGDFRVRVLSERWAKPLPRESLKLGCATHLAARIREVELLCDNQVMVFARSIIPLRVFQAEPNTFLNMGSKPLGHLLFRGGGIRKRERDVSFAKMGDGRKVYGRATPYRYSGGEILVSEFFVNDHLIR